MNESKVWINPAFKKVEIDWEIIAQAEVLYSHFHTIKAWADDNEQDIDSIIEQLKNHGYIPGSSWEKTKKKIEQYFKSKTPHPPKKKITLASCMSKLDAPARSSEVGSLIRMLNKIHDCHSREDLTAYLSPNIFRLERLTDAEKHIVLNEIQRKLNVA